MKKILAVILAIGLLAPQSAFAYTYGSGWNERDLEMRKYSVDGDKDSGLAFDANNDDVNDMVLAPTGNLILGGVTYPATDGAAGSALVTDGLGVASWSGVPLGSGTTGNYVESLATTGPLSGGAVGSEGADLTLSIADAVADGATKGAAAFVANDFTSASGVIGLDYTNAQKASTSLTGFLTDTDWDTFNGKQDAINGTGFVKATGTTISYDNSTYATTTVVAGKENYHGVQTVGTMAFSNADKTVTLASISYWYKGTNYTTASPVVCDLDLTADRDNSSNTITANKLYFIYFKDATGKLYWSDTSWNFKENVFVATVYWNGTAGALQKETHAYDRDIDWHIWAHDTIGTRYESGFTLTAPTTAADATLEIETGNIHDEDLDVSTGEMTTMRGWRKVSSSVYTFDDYALPYHGASGDPKFVDIDAGAGYELTSVGDSDFVNYFVYASLDIDRPLYVIPTTANAAFNTIALARAEAVPSVSAVGLNSEWKIIYRFIYKGDGQFQESVDYRSSSPVPGGGTGTVTAGAVSFSPAGNIVATNVQTAIEELDAEKLSAEVDGSITNELPIAGTAIDISGTPASTVDWDSTEVEATTWGAGGNASNAWTFNVSGTDHTMTAGNGLMTFSNAVTAGGKVTANASLDVKNGASTAGMLAIYEDSDDGTNKATFIVPPLTGDTAYTLPPDDGDSGEVLKTNGSGTLTWEADTGGAAFDSTTIDATTWSDGANASNVWTFDVSGTDTTFTAGNGTAGFSHNLTVGGDLTITGDDLTMTTNTSGAVLVADGTNFNPVVMSGDASIGTGGAVVVANDSHTHNSTTMAAASTSAAGIAPQATAPGAGLYNYVGITNGETAYTNKALFDATAPSTQAFGDAAAVGSATVSARRDHKHAMMAAPTTVSGNAGTVTHADAGGDTTTFVSLGTAATGSLAPATDAGFTYNATTDQLQLGEAGVDGSLKIFSEDGGTDHSTIFNPGTQTEDITYTLPVDNGDAGEQLQTNGSGVLSWEAAGGAAAAGWTDGGSYIKTTTDGDSVIIGGATAVGTSGAGVLAIEIGTAPSSSPADMIQLYTADVGSGYQANTAGTGTFSISSGSGATNLNNGVLTDYAYPITDGAGAYIAVDFGAGVTKTITRLGAYANDNNTYNPDDFVIQGSNNNSDWTSIHTVSNLGMSLNTWAYVEFTNTTAYRYYRMYNLESKSEGSVYCSEISLQESVAAQAELRVRDEAGNVTTLSPHNFKDIPQEEVQANSLASDGLAWSYHSEKDGKSITVDMFKAMQILEKLSGEKIIYTTGATITNDKKTMEDMVIPIAIASASVVAKEEIAKAEAAKTDPVVPIEEPK